MYETAVTNLVRRVDGTLAESEGRFPVYADPESGAWTWTGDGGWAGGFWAGLLWLDTSAAAIAAAALTKLAPVAGDAGDGGGKRYRVAAEQILTTLAAGHTGRHGGLVDGCYSHRQHPAERHELIWGDYFALEAMLAVDGVVDPGRL